MKPEIKITEAHLPSGRIKERMAKGIVLTNFDNSSRDVIIQCLLDELDSLYDAFFNLNEHVYRQEYLSHKKKG